MEWDETEALVTAYRELAEETGIVAEPGTIIDCHQRNQFPIKPAWRHRYAPDVRFNIEHVFRLQLPVPVPISLNPAEHSDFLWLTRDQALEKVTSYTNRDAILALD
jgi:dATP pyrophosphohydrolase